ncbi:hypothetical protein X777_07695 [Ooceraea biroi]|uniref:Uncharacterized protein n=1 Tax=Ooceraea biroi TaxID=2015173 RepID=A0A026W9U8_OOCBI|nr:hypothetical protein X777_07695 [Ooceraea biroi]
MCEEKLSDLLQITYHSFNRSTFSHIVRHVSEKACSRILLNKCEIDFSSVTIVQVEI